jgi:hypothetical protein
MVVVGERYGYSYEGHSFQKVVSIILIHSRGHREVFMRIRTSYIGIQRGDNDMMRRRNSMYLE